MTKTERSSEPFKWIGEGTSLNRRKLHQLHYKSFSLGNLKVCVGDFVLVRNDDSMDPEDFMDCFVAQVKDLYDTGEGSAPYQASIQWFSRIYELPSHLLKSLSNVDMDYEVVEENRRHWDTEIDAETIFNKCKVIILPEDADFEKCKAPYENGFPVFFCRYNFKGNKFHPKSHNALNIDDFIGSHVVETEFKRSSSPVIPFQGSSVKLEKKENCNFSPFSSPVKCLKVRLKKIDNELTGSQYGSFKLIKSEPSSPSVDKITKNLKQKLNLRTPTRSSTRSPSTRSQSANSKQKRTVTMDLESKISRSIKRSSPRKASSSRNSTPGHSPSKIKKVIRGLNFLEHEQKITVPVDLETKISKSSKRSSPRKGSSSRNSTPGHSPSKIKKVVRGLHFSEYEKATTVTRSGRKVKLANPIFNENSDDDFEPSKQYKGASPQKAPRKVLFYNSDVSDSGSEFEGSGKSSSDSDSDDFVEEQENKKKSTPRAKRKSSVKTTLSLKRNSASLAIPERKTPLKTPQSVLEESRQRLHVSAVPTSLPCREEEYSDIYGFVRSCLCAHTGGCMYISGVPGTGKTATVHEVVRNLEQEKVDGTIPHFTFIEVNGMWMTDPYQCYVQIFKSLNGKTIQPQQAANLLEKRFSEQGPKKDAVVLLVDELDRLWTRKQTVMYNIFDWPTKKYSKLVVLAIANTMDLPERLMMNRISSRLGLTRKIFQPYTFRQLQEIVMCRIQELQVFDPDAVQLVARKVAAVSGDARRALDICRFAAEVAGQGSVQMNGPVKSTPRKGRKILVSMAHVDAALQQMFSSPIVLAIKASSKLEKMFLESVLAEFNRTGYEETSFSKVFQQVVDRCGFEGIPAPNTSTVSKVCSRLACSHLIIVDNYQNDLHLKIRLNVSADDVNYALTGR